MARIAVLHSGIDGACSSGTAEATSGTGLGRLRRVYLESGCQEFWSIQSAERTVEVQQARSGFRTIYGLGDTIPANALGIGPIQVGEIFDGIVSDQDGFAAL